MLHSLKHSMVYPTQRMQMQWRRIRLLLPFIKGNFFFVILLHGLFLFTFRHDYLTASFIILSLVWSVVAPYMSSMGEGSVNELMKMPFHGHVLYVYLS
jgi:hypothetical protein